MNVPTKFGVQLILLGNGLDRPRIFCYYDHNVRITFHQDGRIKQKLIGLRLRDETLYGKRAIRESERE